MDLLLQSGDYFGTFAFALTGGLAAAEKRLDFGGFLLLAFATGVGGGTLRDLILDRGMVFWTDQPAYILLCLAGAATTFVWGTSVKRLHSALVWGDAVGLSVFAVIGAGIAIQSGHRPITAVLMGALTATGGGVIRDVIRNELPMVLHREVYVSAAFAGALTLVLLHEYGSPAPVAVTGGFGAAFALRAAGIAFDLHLPVYRARGGVAGAPDARTRSSGDGNGESRE
jgi:uncharacterized membrane protein YeiH